MELHGKHAGLSDSHHIGKILIDPQDPNHVIVGVTGHLYSPNAERGIYETTDGGKQWTQASSLTRKQESSTWRMPQIISTFNLQLLGKKTEKHGILKAMGNTLGFIKVPTQGKTWRLISTEESGFPTGEGVGRIGLAVYDDSTLYAIHDSQFRRPEEDKKRKWS